MNVPTEVWILIADDDARLWNKLVRAIPGLHTQKLMGKMKDRFNYKPDSDQHWGEICGKVHTECKYHRIQFTCSKTAEVMVNYGMLSNEEHQHALIVDAPHTRIKIYATKDIPVRSSGPAAMICEWATFSALDAYFHNGSITKVNLFDFRCARSSMLITLLPGKGLTVTYYKGPHYRDIWLKYPQNSIEEIVETSVKIGNAFNCNMDIMDAVTNVQLEIENLISESTRSVWDDVPFTISPNSVLSMFEIKSMPKPFTISHTTARGMVEDSVITFYDK